MVARRILLAGLFAAGAAGLALAAPDADRRDGATVRHHHIVHGAGHASIERAAMQNILAELLSEKTGRPAAEIAAMFGDGPPHEALEQLGIAGDQMPPLFQQAHAMLIKKAAAAGLITATQAAEIEARPPPRPRHRKGEGDDR